MLTLAFRFPAGRYHANPWGRHVNEGDVEWPPSPWRLLRALISVWHFKADHEDFPESDVEMLVNALAEELPRYRLPRAVLAHSRHYMPIRSGKSEKTSLVFDAFARVDRQAPLVMAWPNVELAENTHRLLDFLLSQLPYLGRAESWVEAEILEQELQEFNCIPSDDSVDESTGELYEPVRMIAPMSANAYRAWQKKKIDSIDWSSLTKKPRTQLEKTLPGRLLDALQLETADTQAAGWSRAPGARFVTYQRPEDCLTVQPPVRAMRGPRPKVQTVRLALHGKPRPRIEDAVKIGELVRLGAMSASKRGDNPDYVSPVISGHDLQQHGRHQHAFYLPEDADNDGRIDHVLIHAEIGFDPVDLRALGRLEEIWDKKGGRWQVILESYGNPADYASLPYLGPALEWESVTPYSHPWFAKKNFGIAEQLARECRSRGIAEPLYVREIPQIDVRGRPRRPVHFHRFRTTKGRRLRQPDTKGQLLRLRFPEPIHGPLALGFGCHFGLGLFRAVHAGQVES